jgi:hypothetical protein
VAMRRGPAKAVQRTALAKDFLSEVPLRFEAETLDLSLFYKGFAHLVDFLARAYGHFGFRHRAWEI